MPIEFLTDEQLRSHGRFNAEPTPAERPVATAAARVALYLNRRLWPFTALNSWTGSLFGGFKSWLELHLNRRQPRFFEFAGSLRFKWDRKELGGIDQNSSFMVGWLIKPIGRKHALERHSEMRRRRW